MDNELQRLTAAFPPSPLADPSLLEQTAEVLDFDWPADYRALLMDHNGVEGQVGTWYVVLTPVEDLIEDNAHNDWSSHALIIGSDGAEEHFAFDRKTREVLLIRSDDDGSNWIILGTNLAEAFAHLERDDVFDDPRYRDAVQRPKDEWPMDWRERFTERLQRPDA